ncbi:thiamine phosphate synthase [Pigmentibacter sp. JX0631]|uniref:thiamine phosphate synthase n=1 Tax=Pigmentibacter sp. JX0631 TaxID=2976982 RepID=UPI0024694694|nr:thiamine phosphate synthase [Pigmentibacter sp. JX0631]WGL60142.1 thiamine phosphate synthase [Pigmentibacter sp. JX0631]
MFNNNNPFSFHFYPIVDSLYWLKKLIENNVPISQYRVKKSMSVALEEEIKTAIELAKANNHLLIINDFWELAIKYNAFGVHLGFEDSLIADTNKIQQSGLLFGLSTHDEKELNHAIHLEPQYIALGPIFPTTSKIMRFLPQGYQKISEWREKIPSKIKLVAIGGIELANAEKIYQSGANCISVISDITKAKNPDERLQQWLKKQNLF